MEKRKFQMDYNWEEEPLLVLPLCVGGMLLSGELFGWLRSLNPEEMTDDHIAAFKIIYWGFLLCCASLAAWRLMRTVHATGEGLEYRFLGKRQSCIPWSEFSCAILGRAWQQKRDLIWLIPVSLGEPPNNQTYRSFLGRNYSEIPRFHRTKNNILAIETHLGELKKGSSLR